jgi:hypothetical protein
MFHSHDSAQRKIQKMGKNRPRVGYEDETDPDVRSVAEASGYSEGTKTGLQKDLGTGKELRARGVAWRDREKPEGAGAAGWWGLISS